MVHSAKSCAFPHVTALSQTAINIEIWRNCG